MPTPGNWGAPSYIEDYSTKEHFQDLKEIICETYRESKYRKPIAIAEALGCAFLYDGIVTAGRAIERFWKLTDFVVDSKDWFKKLLYKSEKKNDV